MPENRFFLETSFQQGLLVQLDEEEFHHLRVMRRNEGDIVELVNGQNQLAHGQITGLTKKNAALTLIEVIHSSPPSRSLILAQCCLRQKNLELVLEKGTELGATEFWLFPGQRSEKDTFSPTQLNRLRHLCISAMKQCGRLDLPAIRQMPPLFEWKEFPKGKLFYGDPKSTIGLTPSESDITIFIGPEKGFSEEEENHLRNQFKATGIRLNPNVLRAETAAICSLSIINNI